VKTLWALNPFCYIYYVIKNKQDEKINDMINSAFTKSYAIHTLDLWYWENTINVQQYLVGKDLIIDKFGK